MASDNPYSPNKLFIPYTCVQIVEILYRHELYHQGRLNIDKAIAESTLCHPDAIMKDIHSKWMECEEMEPAKKYIPHTEVKSLEEHSSNKNEDYLRTKLVIGRWSNRICHNCKFKRNDLQTCDQCFIVFYCSKECQEKDREEHKSACKNPNAPPDKYNAPLLIQMK